LNNLRTLIEDTKTQDDANYQKAMKAWTAAKNSDPKPKRSDFSSGINVRSIVCQDCSQASSNITTQDSTDVVFDQLQQCIINQAAQEQADAKAAAQAAAAQAAAAQDAAAQDAAAQDATGQTTSDDSGDGANTGMIVGLSVGGLALVIIIVLVVLLVRSNRRASF
jgi:hypothetical protein